MSRRFWLRAASALMLALGMGCVAAHPLTLDARKPSVKITQHGFYLGGERMPPEDIPDRLESYGVQHDQAIHILIDEDIARDLRPAKLFMAYLAKRGYSRSVLVTERHAYSEKVRDVGGPAGGGAAGGRRTPAARPKVRYKGANE